MGATIPTGAFESRIKSSLTWPVIPTLDNQSFTHRYTPPDHFICLNAAFRADLLWWHVFSAGWNRISLIPAIAVLVQVTSDVSGS